MTSEDKKPFLSLLDKVYGPLIKLCEKLPAPLAYGLATLVAVLATFLFAALFNVVLPIDLLWFISVISLAVLVSFILIDWRNRTQKLNPISPPAHDRQPGIIEEVQRLAIEYERLRSRLAPGKKRTRDMNIVTSKMQQYSDEIRQYYSRLSKSDSPGERLSVVMALQKNPEIDWINWLGLVASTDETFLGHQATISLMESAKKYKDMKSKLLIEDQIEKIEAYIKKQKMPSNRSKILPAIKRELTES